MWAKGLISLYVLMLILSPAVRLPGIPGMRGVTGDQVLSILLLIGALLFWRRGFVSAIRLALTPHNFTGMGYLAIVLIAILAAAVRVLFDTSMDAPVTEFARLYGLLRPELIILLAALFYRMQGQYQNIDVYQQFVSAVLIFGAIAIFLGLAQGMGNIWVVDFLNTYYTRDLNFEDVLIYGRAYATFDGQPNVFGTFCGLYILLLLNRMKGVTSIIILAPLMVGAGLGLLFSGSRGALLALLISMAVWAILSRNMRAFITIAVGGLCALVIISISTDLVSSAMMNRLAAAVGLYNEPSIGLASSRLPYWTLTLNLLTVEPLRVIWGIPGVLMPPTDNLQLALIASLGLIGLLVYMTLLIIMCLRQYRIREPHSIEFLVFLLFLLLNGTSYPTLLYARIGDLFWMSATLLFLSSRVVRRY